MRPVNLLPPEHRPLTPSGRRGGSGYIVVAALALALVAAIGYVVTANTAAARNAEAARLARSAAAAEARAAALAPFGEFSQLKQARFEAVSRLAVSRLDWERLARELALVLPDRTWLLSVDGDAATDVAATPAAQPAAGSDTPTGPSVTIAGCGKSQTAVATALVRLRRLSGATDVELQQSTGNESHAKGKAGKAARKESTGTGTSSSSPGGAGPADGCGKDYDFSARVLLAPTQAAATPVGTRRVPASLGGGS
jgi:Tfp pilus assembly protein PilN